MNRLQIVIATAAFALAAPAFAHGHGSGMSSSLTKTNFVSKTSDGKDDGSHVKTYRKDDHDHDRKHHERRDHRWEQVRKLEKEIRMVEMLIKNTHDQGRHLRLTNELWKLRMELGNLKAA